MYLKTSIKTECSGCMACSQVCPQKCICMVEDTEGFLYPNIDTERCINCGLCQSVCPRGYKDFYPVEDINAYYGKHHDETIIMSSSSGGAFSAICEVLIHEGCSIYGVKQDEKLKICHARANSIEECKSFRKSKYIQSNIDDTYKQILDQLNNKQKVCFSGTPCQIAALKNFLKVCGTEEDNLITVAVLCRGVSNQKLFDLYRNEFEEKENKKIVSAIFRYKDPKKQRPYSRSMKLVFNDKTERKEPADQNEFLLAYYSRLSVRPSCGECEFSRKERVADITIGDAWHIEKKYPNFQSLKGTSLLLTSTPKGDDIINNMKSIFDLNIADTEWAITSQGIIQHIIPLNGRRKKFLSYLRKKDFLLQRQKLHTFR